MARVVPYRVLHRHCVSARSEYGLCGDPDRTVQVRRVRELQGMNELYDLDKDPFEETNIVDRPDA